MSMTPEELSAARRVESAIRAIRAESARRQYAVSDSPTSIGSVNGATAQLIEKSRSELCSAVKSDLQAAVESGQLSDKFTYSVRVVGDRNPTLTAFIFVPDDCVDKVLVPRKRPGYRDWTPFAIQVREKIYRILDSHHPRYGKPTFVDPSPFLTDAQFVILPAPR